MPFRLQSAASFCWSSWVNGICGGISARSVGTEAARRVPVVPLLECNDGRSLLAAALSAMGIALQSAFGRWTGDPDRATRSGPERLGHRDAGPCSLSCQSSHRRQGQDVRVLPRQSSLR